MSGGVATKIIALGIGIGADMAELRGMASPPENNTVILVDDFSNLSTVEDQLLDEACNGKQIVNYSKSLHTSELQFGFKGLLCTVVQDSTIRHSHVLFLSLFLLAYRKTFSYFYSLFMFYQSCW